MKRNIITIFVITIFLVGIVNAEFGYNYLEEETKEYYPFSNPYEFYNSTTLPSGGSGGNPFDQSLNTTDEVQFANLTFNDVLNQGIKGTYGIWKSHSDLDMQNNDISNIDSFTAKGLTLTEQASMSGIESSGSIFTTLNNANFWLGNSDYRIAPFFIESQYGNVESDGNITANKFIGDGSLLTGISGGSGGNPFNQSLNTSDNVKFGDLTIQRDNNLYFKVNSTTKNVQIGNDEETSLGTEGLFQFKGDYNGYVSSMIYFNPQINGGSSIYFNVKPTLNNTGNINEGFRMEPSFITNGIFNAMKLNYVIPTIHNITYKIIEEISAKTFVNTNVKSTYEGIEIGGATTIMDFGGGTVDFKENMITLNGGITTVGSLSRTPTQTGIEFNNFGTIGTGSVVKGIDADGGQFDFLGGSYINSSNIEADNYYSADSTQGATKTIAINNVTGVCTLIFKNGLYTGGTC